MPRPPLSDVTQQVVNTLPDTFATRSHLDSTHYLNQQYQQYLPFRDHMHAPHRASLSPDERYCSCSCIDLPSCENCARPSDLDDLPQQQTYHQLLEQQLEQQQLQLQLQLQLEVNGQQLANAHSPRLPTRQTQQTQQTPQTPQTPSLQPTQFMYHNQYHHTQYDYEPQLSHVEQPEHMPLRRGKCRDRVGDAPLPAAKRRRTTGTADRVGGKTRACGAWMAAAGAADMSTMLIN